MHSKGVAHLDVKLDNILMDINGVVKVADFGQSRRLQSKNDHILKPCGTKGYFAPELTRDGGFKGFPVDCWAAGICLFVLLNGFMPFDMYNLKELQKLNSCTLQFFFRLSDLAQDLIKSMLQRDPEKRITAREILAHPWFDDVDPSVEILNEP